LGVRLQYRCGRPDDRRDRRDRRGGPAPVPDHWDTDPAWSTDYIERHLALGAQVGKPVFLGEYGWRGTDTRNAVFHQWLTAFRSGGGDIALYWIMQPRSELVTPPDSDGFTAYCPSPVCTQVSYWSQSMLTGRTDFPPVVDDDYLLLSAGRPGTLDLLANDVSLFTQLDRASVQLDSSPPGVSLADGRVSYQPPPGFSGVVEFTYTVADVQGRVSAPASVTIRLVTR